MAEQTTNYIEIDGEGKYIEDTAAREGVAQNTAAIAAINEKIPTAATATNKLVDTDQLKNKIAYQLPSYPQSIGGGASLDALTTPGFFEYSGIPQAGYGFPDFCVGSQTWGNILVMGIINRLTQILTLPYTHQQKIFIRYRHDTVFSAWKEL